jgi:hypothetical protein
MESEETIIMSGESLKIRRNDIYDEIISISSLCEIACEFGASEPDKLLNIMTDVRCSLMVIKRLGYYLKEYDRIVKKKR